MNKQRRAILSTIQSTLEALQAELEQCRDDEQDAFDNMPECLQESERGEKSQSAINAIEEALENVETAISACETAAE